MSQDFNAQDPEASDDFAERVRAMRRVRQAQRTRKLAIVNAVLGCLLGTTLLLGQLFLPGGGAILAGCLIGFGMYLLSTRVGAWLPVFPVILLVLLGLACAGVLALFLVVMRNAT